MWHKMKRKPRVRTDEHFNRIYSIYSIWKSICDECQTYILHEEYCWSMAFRYDLKHHFSIDQWFYLDLKLHSLFLLLKWLIKATHMTFWTCGLVVKIFSTAGSLKGNCWTMHLTWKKQGQKPFILVFKYEMFSMGSCMEAQVLSW